MKILHVAQLIGGLDIYIRNSIAYSADKGFDFVIIHGKEDENEAVLCGGIPVKEYKVDLYRKLDVLNDLRCLFQVWRIVWKEKPDIIHCHSAKGGFIGRLIGFLTNTKTFYTPHAFSFLCTPKKIKQRIYLHLERLARLNSYLLACSESERKMGIEKVKYKVKHALTWHNSVPDASQRHGKTDNTTCGRYISYIGRPCYQKNPFFLLDVIKKVTEKDATIKFYLLGVGYHSPKLEEMRQKAEKMGLSGNIVLVPWLNHDDCLEYVRKSLFYLSCSLYEGLPLSVIEAMAMGKAIIASDVVGNTDCVINNRNGYLLPLDAEAFANKIIEIATDTTKRKDFERESRQMFLDHFLLDKQITKLHNIYKNDMCENILTGGVETPL